MNLIYSCVFYNENYLNLIEKLLTSFYKHNKDSNINYLIITCESFKNKVIKICNQIGLKFDIWILDICNTDSTVNNIYESTYSRYAIYNYPKLNNYKKILYLDCDILIINNLKPLFEINLTNHFYTLFEEPHRICHCATFNDDEFEEIKNKKETFTSAIILFNNNNIMCSYLKNIFTIIQNHHQKYKKPFSCYDQPIFNKIGYINKIINNKILGEYCFNVSPHDNLNILPTLVKYLLCHFATNVGDYNSKIIRTTKAEEYLNNYKSRLVN
ncbi:hypothetical protein CL656_05580 [bacterium]|nr:hypothetical protein [bacterium]